MTSFEISLFVGIAAILIFQFLLWMKQSSSNSSGGSNDLQDQFQKSRVEVARSSKELREEVRDTIQKVIIDLKTSLGGIQKDQSTGFSKIQNDLQNQINTMRDGVRKQLTELRDGNEKKLDQMRATVDEKLQSTLEKRLGESFKLVSERLEAVQKGLGEMKGLAEGVGDLKRVLSNVKVRGTWGEVQLKAILEQLLTDGQYEANVKTKSGSNDLVEFAIKLPGAGNDPEKCVYLPIDSKFPQDDYMRLIEASENADVAGVETSSKALVRSIISSAKEINNKYVDPPNTTDFAIMFLPTEGLYAEVLRQPGLMEKIQSDSRVVVTGPTTLSATVNSLRLGFQTLAITKRSSEVWEVLSAVKTEFGKFGVVMDKVKRQLKTVSNTIELTNVRTKAMGRKLKEVESMPAEDASTLLGLDDQIDVVSDEVEEQI